jgi:DNA-directed RNA polymerase subunit RPC12/RpoP
MTSNAIFTEATEILAGDDCWYLQLDSEDFDKPGYLPRVIGPFHRLVDLCLEAEGYPDVESWETVLDSREVPRGAIRPTKWARDACVVFSEYAEWRYERTVLGFLTEAAARQWLMKYGSPHEPGYEVIIGDPRRAFPASDDEYELRDRLVSLRLHIDEFERSRLLTAQYSGGKLLRCPGCAEAYSPQTVKRLECPKCGSRRRILRAEENEKLAQLNREFRKVAKKIEALKAQPGRPTTLVAKVLYKPPSNNS